MPTARKWPTVVNTGTPEYLIVAGGHHCERVVEVLMEGQWWSLPSLPYNILYGYSMATIHEGTLHMWGAYCDLQALLASRLTPNSTARSYPDGLWSVVNYGHCSHVGHVSFQGQLLYSIGEELRVRYNDSLVTIGRAVGRNMLIGGELIYTRWALSGYCFYTASVKGTIIAIVVNVESLAVFPPPFSVFISSRRAL
jgi:hypothetical protein